MTKKEKILIAIVFVATMIAAVYVNFCQAQTMWTPVKSDTIVSSNISVVEYTKRDGGLGIKAKWCGKAVNISQKDGNAILEGDDAAVVLVTYKIDGRTVVEPKKIIAVNMRRGR